MTVTWHVSILPEVTSVDNNESDIIPIRIILSSITCQISDQNGCNAKYEIRMCAICLLASKYTVLLLQNMCNSAYFQCSSICLHVFSIFCYSLHTII